MVSYPIDTYIEDPEWQRHLKSHWHTDKFQNLLSRLDEEEAQTKIYPPKELRFAAFKASPWAKTKVLLLGQDPYHGPNQAHGLSFSVPLGQKIPPSLRNIYKELHSDLNIEPALGGDLSSWAEQGVLLLNSFLTVEAGKAGSHQKWGWAEFTDGVIQELSDQKSGMVFILWGNFAQRKLDLIDSQKHLIIQSAHPSPLSARHGFFNSKPFSRCNDYLVQQGKEPINWQLPW